MTAHRLNRALKSVPKTVPIATIYGRLMRVNGLMLEAVGCQLGLGERCVIAGRDGQEIEAEVVGFDGPSLMLMPLNQTRGLMPGARVLPLANDQQVPIGQGLLGRVLDGSGVPIDGLGPLSQCQLASTTTQVPNPLLRRPIEAQLDVGVRAINSMLPIGKGQRLGLFAGSGVGKSVLLGMMTRYTQASVVVVGLIGERGREVREFIEHALGEEGRRRAVVIAAPADTTPLMRLRAAKLCHQIACAFRDQGQDVLLLMDSLTRYAQAQREIGLSLGEPPATRGYPPSAFSTLPSLVELAGNSDNANGSLTALYTVLAEGDDQQDPVADSARAILDGHIVLSRKLAEKGHYPAIDINASASRVADLIRTPEQLQMGQTVRRLLGRYQEVKELLPLGGYQPGQDAELDKSVKCYPVFEQFLTQKQFDSVSLAESDQQLESLLEAVNSA